MTGAERQRAWRRRRAGRLAAAEAECAGLRAEVAGLRARLEAALGEAERAAGMACRHPAAAVQAGTCLACGLEVW